MSKRPFVLLSFLLMLLMAVSANAMYVEVGDGTSTTDDVPSSNYYDYSWSRTIYLASEINQAIPISGISYHMASGSSITANDQTIYMKHSHDSVFSSDEYISDPIADGYTQVFSGTVSYATGWVDIELDTTFDYNGSDNIIILWENNDGSYSYSRPYFYYTSQTDRTVFAEDDDDFPTIAGDITSSVPNIRFNYTIAGAVEAPTTPIPANLATEVSLDVNQLTWTFGENTESYDLFVDTVNPPVNQVVTGSTNITAEYAITLAPHTTYYWQVVAHGGGYDATGGVWNFTTESGINLVNYAVEQNTPVEVDMTGATTLGTGADSGTFTTEFPFDFSIYNEFYAAGSEVKINCDGFIGFGGTIPYSSTTIPNSSYSFLSWGGNTDARINGDVLSLVDGNRWIISLSYQTYYSTSSSSYEADIQIIFDATDKSITVNYMHVVPATSYQANYLGINKGDGEFYTNMGLFPESDIAYVYRYVETAPLPASNPSPADEEEFVSLTGSQLTWDFGENTETYDLYFDTVNPPVGQVVTGAAANTGAYSFTADASTTYYWQVVSHGSGVSIPSPVWSFSTDTGITLVNYVVQQSAPVEVDMTGATSIGTGADSGTFTTQFPFDFSFYNYFYPQGTDVKINCDGFIGFGGTIPGYSTSIPNTTYKFLSWGGNTDARINGDVYSLVDGDRWILSLAYQTYYYTSYDSYEADIQIIFDSTDMSMTVNYMHVVPAESYQPNYLGVNRGDGVYYTDMGLFPESDIAYKYVYNVNAPTAATEPVPANGATQVDYNLTQISWTAGERVDNYDVYFGTTNPPALFSQDLPSTTTSVTVSLEQMTTYFWKVVSRNTEMEVETPVWSFGTDADILTSFPYYEGFNQQVPPAGWGVEDVANTAGEWLYATVSEHPADVLPVEGEGMARFNSFNCASGSQTRLSSMYMTLPSNALMALDVYHDTGYDNKPNEGIYVQINTEGDTWTSLANITRYRATAGWDTHVVDLSTYSGQTVRIGILGDSEYGNDVHVDNVIVADANTTPDPVDPILPEDGATEVALSGNLQWGSNMFATGYRLTLASVNPAVTIVDNVDLGNVNTYAFSGLNTGTVYNWSITPYSAGGSATGIPTWSFTTLEVPASTTLVSPDDGEEDLTNELTLEWNPTSGATGYKLFVGTDNPPTDVLNGTDVATDTTYALSSLTYDTVYYWQVVPYNANGDAVDCPVWSFSTVYAPNSTTLTSPTNASTERPDMGVLIWNTVSDAEGYYLNIGTSESDPTDVLNMYDMTTNNMYVYQGLEFGRTYYWQVIPYNYAGNAHDCPVWNFTIAVTNTNYGHDSHESYFFANSTAGASEAPSQPTYAWADTTGHMELDENNVTSGSVSYGAIDDGYWTCTLPFDFPFYGTNYNTFYASTNGLLSFSTESANAWTNAQIPNSANPNGLIAPLWEDAKYFLDFSRITFNATAYSATITYYQMVDIQANDNDMYSTYQVNLFPDGKIIICYNVEESSPVINDSDSYFYGATVGIESPDASDGIEYRYGAGTFTNYSGGVLADGLDGSMALAFGPDANDLGWPAAAPDVPVNVAISVSGGNATLSWDAAANAQSYNVYYSATADGVYTLLQNVIGTSYQHTGVTGNGFYYVTADNTPLPTTVAPVSVRRHITNTHSTQK